MAFVRLHEYCRQAKSEQQQEQSSPNLAEALYIHLKSSARLAPQLIAKERGRERKAMESFKTAIELQGRGKYMYMY